MAWRVGKHYGIHVYDGDRPVATFHLEEDAKRAVEAMDEKPLLGLARTHELLQEISARMRISQNSVKGIALAEMCDEALDNLGAGVLEYRTVDPT